MRRVIAGSLAALVTGCTSFHAAPATGDGAGDASVEAATSVDAARGRDAAHDAHRDAATTGSFDATREAEAAPLIPDAKTPPRWTQMVSGVFGEPLNAIWGSGASDVYAVGGNGKVVHSRGDGTWSAQTTPFGISDFYAVWGSSASDVHGVTLLGDDCRSGGDAGWTCSLVAQDLTTIWGFGPSDYYVASDLGVILHTTDAGATPVENSAHAFGLYGLWGTSDSNLYAAADDGQILHSVPDGGWVSEVGGESGGGGTLWGSSAADIYAAGGQTLYHSTGDGTWTQQVNPATGVLLSGVWGSSPSDVFAVGDKGTIEHSTGDGTWVVETTATSADLYAVWGSGPDDVYAVGNNGVILHRNVATSDP